MGVRMHGWVYGLVDGWVDIWMVDAWLPIDG